MRYVGETVLKVREEPFVVKRDKGGELVDVNVGGYAIMPSQAHWTVYDYATCN